MTNQESKSVNSTVSIEGKTVLITGAGSGIGYAMAKEFSNAGASVIVNDLNDIGFEIADELNGRFLKADLSNMDATRFMCQQALDLDGKVDILINNAGLQQIAPVDEFPDDVWENMIRVMLTAPFQTIKYLIPKMKSNGWGRIINISSIHGLVASPYKVAYNSAKHGLIGLTKTVALEVGEYGITVNAICPGYTRTPLVEAQISDQAAVHGISRQQVLDKIMLESAAIKRLIDPTEIAKLALFLASDDARSITGSAYPIDLGWVAR